MEAKFNDETQSRPHGIRFTDGDILKIDLPAYIQQIKAEESWKNRDRNAITVFKSDHTTITLVYLQNGAAIVPGSFDGTGLMTLQVIEGNITFVNGENELELTAGQMVTVHEHIPFNAVANEDSVGLMMMIKVGG